MPYLRSLLFAAIAAGVGCGVWVAVAQQTGLQLVLLALPIAALVGAGAAFGAKGYASDLTGVMALVLTAGAIAGAVLLSQDAIEAVRRDRLTREIQDFYPQFDREVMMSYVADQVVDDWAQSGRRMQWPAHTDEETRGWYAQDYPRNVWTEAERRYDSYPPDDQAMIYDAFERHHDELMQEDIEFMLADTEEQTGVLNTSNRPRVGSVRRLRRGRIGLFGIGFWIVSAATAWGIGRGGWGD